MTIKTLFDTVLLFSCRCKLRLLGGETAMQAGTNCLPVGFAASVEWFRWTSEKVNRFGTWNRERCMMFRQKKRLVLGLVGASNAWTCDLLMAKSIFELLPALTYSPEDLVRQVANYVSASNRRFRQLEIRANNAIHVTDDPRTLRDCLHHFYGTDGEPHMLQITRPFNSPDDLYSFIQPISRVRLVAMVTGITPHESPLRITCLSDRQSIQVPDNFGAQFAVVMSLIYSVDYTSRDINPKNSKLPKFRYVVDYIDNCYGTWWIAKCDEETKREAIANRDQEWFTAVKRINFASMARALERSKLGQDEGPEAGKSQTVAAVKKALVALAAGTGRADTPEAMLAAVIEAMQDWTEHP